LNEETPPLVVGAGVAGLVTALALAPRPVRLVVRGRLGTDGSTLWAQGGIAAAVGTDDDPALHAEDTERAGAGLCDPAVVRLVTEAAPTAVERLAAWGVPFDRS
jgi:L-aspartate oxidase